MQHFVVILLRFSNFESNEFYRKINPFCAETGVYQGTEINAIAADALVPHISRSSAMKILTVQNKWVFLFHMGGFQRLAPPQFW